MSASLIVAGLSLLAVGCYVTTAGLAVRVIKQRTTGAAATNDRTLWIWGSGVVLHAGALYVHTVTPVGVNLAFFNALSVVALLITALLLILMSRWPLQHLAIPVLSLASLSILLDLIIRNDTVIAPTSGIQLHVVISLVAYSLLSIAAMQAVLLFFQDYQLRHRHPGGWVRALPSLHWMEHLLFRLIVIGFTFLSLALATGFVFLQDLFQQHLVHKTVLSITAWIVFAILLWGRWQFGWRGQTAIRWTLGGFLALMLAYFGSKLMLEFVLPR